jgi:hypothetical protein
MTTTTDGLMAVFTPFEKMIEGVPNRAVAKDELDSEMTLKFGELVITELDYGHIRIKTGLTIYFTREVKIEATTCTHHPMWLKFEGSLGAPGHGQSWKCPCGEALWSPFGAAQAVPFKDLDESVFIFSEDEVR